MTFTFFVANVKTRFIWY